MEYLENRPIWLQIHDRMCSRIAEGAYPAGERMPSIRELAAEMQVNPNTVVRVYERMEHEGMIANRRGVGYFTTETALRTVNDVWRREFLDKEVPQFFRRMEQFGIDLATLERLYQQFKQEQS